MTCLDRIVQSCLTRSENVRFEFFPINHATYSFHSNYVYINLFLYYLCERLPRNRSYKVGFKVGSRGVVIVSLGSKPWVSNQAYFRGTALIRGIRVVIDYPTGSTHSENLWSRANIDLYYFNKNYTGIIPPYKLSFIIESALREPLAVLSGSSLNTYKWCCRSFKILL